MNTPDQSEAPLKLSVIIVTRNRSDAMKRYALRSLCEQVTDFPFEVLVWDASDDEATRDAVNATSIAQPDLNIRWRKAPRVGSASQRNDALAATAAPIVLFMDDDLELPASGLRDLVGAFAADPALGGATLPVETAGATISGRKYWIQQGMRLLRLPNGVEPRRIAYRSGWGGHDLLHDVPARADWLSGCCMAVRREALGDIHFNEQLEHFGGYALGEDFELCQRLLRRGGHLEVLSGPTAVHHLAPGGARSVGAHKVATRIYNHYVIWRSVFKPYEGLNGRAIFLYSFAGNCVCSALLALANPAGEVFKGLWWGVAQVVRDAWGRD